MKLISLLSLILKEAKSERTKTGYKVPGKYLTKDKADMKDEIERVRNLSSDDPSAYGKWKADYADKSKTKKYKTKTIVTGKHRSYGFVVIQVHSFGVSQSR